MKSSILHTQNLTIGYQNRQKTTVIAQNLNLVLEQGEIVCLLGPNGAGKSTLLRTFAGILKSLGGDIFIENQNTTTLSSSKMAKKMALVLTNPVYANFSVIELVGMGRYPHTGQFGQFSEIDHQKIKQALTETQTLGFANRKLNTLSDGERQKVMIARALAQDTPLIILDEPTAHLDLPNRMIIFQLLKKLAQDYQKAVLICTHELDFALQTADKVWIQTDQSVHTGTPEDLVLNGIFSKTFEKHQLIFDKSTGRFLMTQPYQKQIRVRIRGTVGVWTKRALERIGFSPNSTKNSTTELPEISYSETKQIWHLQTVTGNWEVNSIEELIQILRENFIN